MIYAGINSQDVKYSNRRKIMRLLNDRGMMPRKDIAAELGLTPAAVTQICNDLIALGVVKEHGAINDSKSVGRKKILLGLNYEYKKAVCVCIEINETFISICGLNGEILDQIIINTETGTEPEIFIEKICGIISDMTEKLSCESGDFIGLGISVPGKVDCERGISKRASRIWNKEVNLAGEFSKHISLPMIVENNVKAFAEAELVYGSGREADSIMFIKWGPGVGSAFVINKEIYDNPRYGFSELGHVIAVEDGRSCRCGRRGCLETEVNTHALTDAVRDIYGMENTPLLFQQTGGDIERLSVSGFKNWADSDDKGMQDALKPGIYLMAREAVNAVSVLPTDKIIYYGDIFEVEFIRRGFESRFAELFNDAPGERLMYSKLSSRLGYIGALALVFNRFFIV